jgi:F-type H+-transporting ATPase subunit alpha
VVETQAGNISAYIPTNLISITDGQVFVSSDLFQKGILPAVDVGRSVSRVGGSAQLRPYRSVVRGLRLSYAQFEELEIFSRFATQLDDETRRTLERGRRVREILKQPETAPMEVDEQVVVLFAAVEGVFDSVEPDDVLRAGRHVWQDVRRNLPELCRRIASGDLLGDTDLAVLRDQCRTAAAHWETENVRVP